MRVRVEVNAAAAIAAGLEPVGVVFVEVPVAVIPEDLRPVLAGCPIILGVAEINRFGSTYYTPPPVARADMESVVTLLRWRQAILDAAVAALEAGTAGITSACGDDIVVTLHDCTRIYVPIDGPAKPYYEAYRTAEREREATRRATEKAETARRIAERHAGLERMRTWAVEHGSARLHLAMELGQPWEMIAHAEFFAAMMPEGYDRATYESGDNELRKAPTLEELQELQRMIAVCEASAGVLSDPGIYYHTVELEGGDPDDDDPYAQDDEEQSEKFVAVHVTINAPDGEWRKVARKMTDP